MRLFSSALLLLTLSACSGPGSRQEETQSISNGLVKIEVNQLKGRYSFIDLVKGDTLIQSAGFQCLTDQTYVRGRERLKFFRLLDDSSGSTFCSADTGRVNYLTQGKVESNLGEGNSITLTSTLEGENVLVANFTIYPDQAYIDISWGI